jgi:hypothetical protein
LREDRRVRVFENGVLRRIFRAMSERETGEWRKLQKELNCQYCSTVTARGTKINENKIGRACSTYAGEGTRIQEIDGEIRGKEYTWETQTEMGV